MNGEYKKLILLFVVQVVGWEILEGIGISIASPTLKHLIIAIAYAPLVILMFKVGRNPKFGCLIHFMSSIACAGIIIAWGVTFVMMLLGKI